MTDVRDSLLRVLSYQTGAVSASNLLSFSPEQLTFAPEWPANKVQLALPVSGAVALTTPSHNMVRATVKTNIRPEVRRSLVVCSGHGGRISRAARA